MNHVNGALDNIKVMLETEYHKIWSQSWRERQHLDYWFWTDYELIMSWKWTESDNFLLLLDEPRWRRVR